MSGTTHLDLDVSLDALSASPTEVQRMTRQIVMVLTYVAVFAVLLFVPAETLQWPAAWILLSALLLARGLSMVLLWRERRSLLTERIRFPLHAGQPWADRLLLPGFMASFAALVAFVSLDRWHLHLLPQPPSWFRALGLMAFIAGWGLVHLALRANAYAVTVVRHQAERGQDVVTTGPYAVVRHPMYAGMLPVMLGLALWLGSTAAVLAATVPLMILVTRIRVEEGVLRAALPSYAAYAARVRWRLLPRVW